MMGAAMPAGRDAGRVFSTGGLLSGLTNPSIDLDFARILPRQALTSAQLQTRLDNACNPFGIVVTRVESATPPDYEGQARGLAIKAPALGRFLVLRFNRNSNTNIRLYMEAEMASPVGSLYIANGSVESGAFSGNHLGYQSAVPNIILQKNTGVGYTALYTKVIPAFSGPRRLMMHLELFSPKAFFNLNAIGTFGHHTGGFQSVGATQTATNPDVASIFANVIATSATFQFWLRRFQISYLPGGAYA